MARLIGATVTIALVLAVVALPAATCCAGSSGYPATCDFALAGAPAASVRGVVSPETGGRVGDERFGFMLSIQAGSVPANTEIKVRRQTEPEEIRVISGKVFGVEAVTLDRALTRLEREAEVVIRFDPEELPPGTRAEEVFVAAYCHGLDAWAAIPTAVSITTGTATGRTVRLSEFALVRMPEMRSLTDLPGHWAEEFVMALQSLGIVSGCPDGKFKPDAVVSRSEFATLVGSAVGLRPVDATGSPLTDVAGHWAAGYIEACRRAGLLMETEGAFRPDEPISRAEMAVVLGRALNVNPFDVHTGFEDDASIPHWARGYVGVLRNMGVISGKPGNAFEPFGTGTRGESARIVWEILMR